MTLDGTHGRQGRLHHRVGGGQGRAHALRLAGEGADIIATDLAGRVDTVSYPPATKIKMWDVPYLDVDDVANAVLFLACEESRYITGVALPVDLGMSMKYSGA